MKYDHIIHASQQLEEQKYHLSCGFYTTTAFLFEQANFAVVIDCKGIFTFYTVDGEKLETITAKPMESGKCCYMDVFITTGAEGVRFKLPEYRWFDNYPYCDGESDRWDTLITGIRDEVFYHAIS